MVVVTDGGRITDSVRTSFGQAEQRNITVILVAISQNNSLMHEEIANVKKKHVFTVNDFNGMPTVIDEICRTFQGNAAFSFA